MKQIWLKGLSKRKNTMACFRLSVKQQSGKFTMRVAGAGSFRVIVNGALVGYGPRRVWMGHSAINEYEISKAVNSADTSIVIEVVYHGTDSFYIVNEQPFLACEIYKDGKLFATAEDFQGYLNESKVQKVIRYSCQRNFLETYEMEQNPQLNYFGDSSSWLLFDTEEVKGNALTSVDLPYPSFKEIDFEKIEDGGIEERADKTPFNCGKSSAFDKLTVAFPQDELESDAVAELSCYYLDTKSNSKNRFTTYQLNGNKTGFIKVKLIANNDCDIYLVFDEICNFDKILHHSVSQR